MIPDLPTPIRGIVPPLVTPLANAELDLPSLSKLVEHVIDGGVRGIFILGTTGEGPHLNYQVRKKLIEATCEQVAGRVPVLVGITDTIEERALEIASDAYASGASAVVAAPSYYLHLSQREIVGQMSRLADQCRLPLFLYNMPSCVKVSIEPDSLAELAEHENIIGFKDSSGDLEYLKRAVDVLSCDPNFTIMIGPEEMLDDAMQMGVHGGVNGGANFFPRLYTSWHAAIERNDVDTSAKLKQLVRQISHTIYAVGKDASRHILGTKAALSELNLCQPEAARPIVGFNDDQISQIGQHVQQLLSHREMNRLERARVE